MNTGATPGEFNNGAGGVAIDRFGNVFATDPRNYRVQKFDSDGNFLAAFGAMGHGPGQFLSGPYGVAVDAAGSVYATDVDGRVQKFDGESGQFVAGWARTGVTQLLATDSSGDIFIRVRHGAHDREVSATLTVL